VINVIIPMAGQGKRFKDAGYELPKPFIDVNGKPMIERVLDNLNILNAKYILLAQSEHIKSYQNYFDHLISKFNVSVLEVPKLTEGAAITTLASFSLINNEIPILIANSDQILDLDFNTFIEDAKNRNLDGSILVFEDTNPKWSFVKVDSSGYFIELKEKVVISNLATVGVYYFSSGNIYLKSVIDMIIQNDRTNNEFYIAPAYNYLKSNYSNKISTYLIDKYKMHGIGTPDDLESYLREII